MTSETDSPRQRTVAELLAEHGGGAATGRRSRRRAADGPDDVESGGGPAPGAPSSYDYAPPVTPDRSILREPVPQDDPPRRAAPEVRRPSGFEAPRETPTDRMPRIPERTPQRFAEPPPPPPRNGTPPPMAQPPMAPPPMAPPQRPAEGPPTMVGSAPAGAEQWHRSRTEQARPDDGGPPTQAGAPLELDDDVDDYDEYSDEYDDGPEDGRVGGRADRYADDEYDDYDEDEKPRRRARGIAGLRDESDDEFDADEFDEEFEEEFENESDERPSRRRAKTAESPAAQSWGAIIAQWIIGAIGGALLWVAFRFLWRDLMVVAIFAAILVTAGLVLIVRHLLRTRDMRTTLFAVGVGLLLTVSPVVLVLLGK